MTFKIPDRDRAVIEENGYTVSTTNSRNQFSIDKENVNSHVSKEECIEARLTPIFIRETRVEKSFISTCTQRKQYILNPLPLTDYPHDAASKCIRFDYGRLGRRLKKLKEKNVCILLAFRGVPIRESLAVIHFRFL